MVDQIAMALDDIIKANKMVFPRGGGGGGAGRKFNATRKPGGGRGDSGAGGGFRNGRTGGVVRGSNRGGISKSANYTRGDVNSAWKHDMYNHFGERKIQTNAIPAVVTGPQAITTGPTKLLVSNLDFGVSGSDIQELFSEFGSLKSAAIHYDRSGRSLGTADVVFERGADAWKAMKQYNGVPLDGKAMSIQLATSEIAEIAFRTDERSGIGGGRGPVWRDINKGGAKRNQGGGGSRGNARRGGGRRVGGAGRGKRPVPTAEQLDAELDAYVKETK